MPSPAYVPRIVDTELATLMSDAPAVVIEGPRGVGKTSTATRIARSLVPLDEPLQRVRLAADPRAVVEALEPPVLIDEWQLDPPVWDAVRRSVDGGWRPGRYVLTGSANPHHARVHTGAARFVHLRMRPLSFAERGLQEPTVGLSALADGTGSQAIGGESAVSLDDYVMEMVAPGFPGIRAAAQRLRPQLLSAYIASAISREVPLLGTVVRRPAALRDWLRAYAAASSTTASYEAIADAVSTEARPARSTIVDYRDVLTQLWLLDDVPAWTLGGARLSQLGRSPKHQLADPALAAALLGVNAEGLLKGRTAADTDSSYRAVRTGPYVGALFEALVTLSIRVYAQPAGFDVAHLRTRGGEHEIDLVLHSPDGRVIAIEVKLNPVVNDRDVRHLNWLASRIGDDLIERIVVTTGPYAYRRPDGVIVVPLALLGP